MWEIEISKLSIFDSKFTNVVLPAPDGEDKIIITHGTDTMVETAKFLEDIENKTIVLTGSMQPARFKKSDAIFNSGFAYAAALSLDNGVYIAMNGKIFSSDNVRKNIDLGRFESKN